MEDKTVPWEEQKIIPGRESRAVVQSSWKALSLVLQKSSVSINDKAPLFDAVTRGASGVGTTCWAPHRCEEHTGLVGMGFCHAEGPAVQLAEK